MQIILLDKVVNLGNLGEIVRVKDGYARNFLIPTGRARRATAAAKQEFETRRVELEKAAGVKLAEAQAVGEKLAGSTCKLTQKAGVDGRLFGSISRCRSTAKQPDSIQLACHAEAAGVQAQAAFLIAPL